MSPPSAVAGAVRRPMRGTPARSTSGARKSGSPCRAGLAIRSAIAPEPTTKTES